MSYQQQRRDDRGRFAGQEWVYVPVQPRSETAKAFHHFVTHRRVMRTVEIVMEVNVPYLVRRHSEAGAES
jgi:hypothetical protein